MKPNNSETKIIVLGGLGEVGKNMYCLMHEDEIIIVDAGISFPEKELLGIDYVIPDFNFLKENEDKIKALVITHGHEDHIGSIPFLVQEVNIPAIYAPNQAKELIAIKLEDRNIRYDNLHAYDDTTVLKFKHFTVEFFKVTHSIPDCHGICLTTKNGSVVTTGDFKFDLTPIGPMADLDKMVHLSERGVDVLISDSTNALNDGFSISESKVDNALNNLFDKYRSNRIIIATFASNIYRLKHIIETCYKRNRKICVFGRSMENNIKISIEGGYIDHKEIIITPDEAKNLKDSEICILCTGSQGEPLAALSRMADGTFRQLALKPDDIVIFSSSAIPGNQVSISRTINKLYMKGIKVLTTTSLSELHTSGHANEEELKLMIRLLKPKYLMPFHGEFRMLKRHSNIGIACGIPKENTFILKNGEMLTLKDHVVTKSKDTVSGDDIYVDGTRIGEVGSVVIRDRKIMSNDGILVVIANINMKKRNLLIRPNITTRGFVMVNENEELIKEIEDVANQIITTSLGTKDGINDIKSKIITGLVEFIGEKIGRNPIVLPVIIDIDK